MRSCYRVLKKKKSQNPRNIDLGLDLWRPSCLKAGTTRAGCSRPRPVGFWLSPGQGFHSLPRYPIPVFNQPYSKKVFSYVQIEFPAFQSGSVIYCSVTGHQWKEHLHLHYTFLSSICTQRWDPTLFLSWTFPALAAFPHKTLQSLTHLCGLLSGSLQCVHVSLALGSPKLHPALQAWVTKA